MKANIGPGEAFRVKYVLEEQPRLARLEASPAP
jgi:hypothetical protein